MAGMVNEKLRQPETIEQRVDLAAHTPLLLGAQQRQNRIKNRLKK